MDVTKDTLWVLGDSFCTEAYKPFRWAWLVVEYLQKKYNCNTNCLRYYNYAGGSMDTQTIIENWIKILPYVKHNDAIIICVSDISRARYPLIEPGFFSLPFQPNPYKAPPIGINFDYAPVGFDPTDSSYDWRVEKMDVPFRDKQSFKDYVKADNILLSSKAHDKNKTELIEALYKITPCHKKFIYTWVEDDILQSDYIYSKDWVTQNVLNGKWETSHDEWLQTNGESGLEHDRHLSQPCEKIMAEYFIKEFQL